MVVSIVVGKGIEVFCAGVNIGELLSVVEINLSHGGDDHTSSLCTVDGLSTIVSQTVCCVVYLKGTFLFCCRIHHIQQQEEKGRNSMSEPYVHTGFYVIGYKDRKKVDYLQIF